jgi:hypothetical protein
MSLDMATRHLRKLEKMSVQGLDLLSQASVAPLEKAVAAKYDLNS